MGCLETLATYSLGEARVISASGEDVWNNLNDPTSEMYQCISTLILIKGFDSQGREKKKGSFVNVRDHMRARRRVGCCGAFDCDWIITSLTGSTNDYPRALSMSLRDDILGCMSTMTLTLNLIPDDEESCIFTFTFCCIPLQWKYIFTAYMHRNACKGFVRDEFNDISAYFCRKKSIKADDQDVNTMNAGSSTASTSTPGACSRVPVESIKADQDVNTTMNAESSTASTSTPDACSRAPAELYEEGPSFRSVTLPLDNSNKTNFSVSKRSESVSAEGSLAAN
jgi:hypothetical protein